MIMLDTHIWVWQMQNDRRLSAAHRREIEANEPVGLGVNVISCWEIAKLVQVRQIELPVPVDQWISQALGYPGVVLLELTPQIAIESTRLPGTFHRDPADQIIVATARSLHLVLLTADQQILDYPHVRTMRP